MHTGMERATFVELWTLPLQCGWWIDCWWCFHIRGCNKLSSALDYICVHNCVVFSCSYVGGMWVCVFYTNVVMACIYACVCVYVRAWIFVHFLSWEEGLVMSEYV